MRSLASTLFLLQLASTLLMTGIIWFVQVVHYPLFTAVGERAFVSYARRHATLTGYVVAPPMLIELATALLALFPAMRPHFVSRWDAIASSILVLGIWGSTGLLQVPLHERLGRSRDLALVYRLVLSNWLRTAAWSARAVLLLLCLYRSLEKL